MKKLLLCLSPIGIILPTTLGVVACGNINWTYMFYKNNTLTDIFGEEFEIGNINKFIISTSTNNDIPEIDYSLAEEALWNALLESNDDFVKAYSQDPSLKDTMNYFITEDDGYNPGGGVYQVKISSTKFKDPETSTVKGKNILSMDMFFAGQIVTELDTSLTINEYFDNRITNILYNNELELNENVLCIEETIEGNIYIGTSHGNIYEVDEFMKIIGKPLNNSIDENGNKIVDGPINSIVQISDGTLLMATSNSIYNLNKDATINFKIEQNINTPQFDGEIILIKEIKKTNKIIAWTANNNLLKENNTSKAYELSSLKWFKEKWNIFG